MGLIGDELMDIFKEENKGKKRFNMIHKIKNYDKAKQEQVEAMEAVSQWENIMKYL